MSGILIEGQKTVQNGVDVYDFTYINWHPRNSDNAGLGDWEVMKSKLLFLISRQQFSSERFSMQRYSVRPVVKYRFR